jgi:diketogulonate reductase-like aldo/keto reductase
MASGKSPHPERDPEPSEGEQSKEATPVIQVSESLSRGRRKEWEQGGSASACLSRAQFLRGIGAATIATAMSRAAPAAPNDDAMSKSAMITRPIPRSGEAMPVIGLGTWQTFDVGGAAKARQPLRQVVQRLVDAGGRMIDSSPMYGRAEGVTGDLVAEMGVRAKVFLATKVWTTGKARGIEQMKRSSTLLRSDVVDLMQIHNLVDWQTQLATMRQMKSQGRIRYLGITHYTASALPELARIIESERDIDFVQLPYSIESREAETELLPVAAARGVAVIVNRPFEEGGLFRRSKGRALPEWSDEIGCKSWAQFFLKYIIGHGAITCVIPATSDPRHMADDLAAGIGPLPDERQRQRMREAWEAA